MIGKYYCPICGKFYTNLNEMYNCAVECEKKEKAKAESAKLNEERRIKAETSIKATYDVLMKKIENYNSTFKNYNYSCTLRHSGKTLAAQNTLSREKDIKIDGKTLDKWIKDIFGIE